MTGSLDIDGNEPELQVSFDSEFSNGSLQPDSVAKTLNLVKNNPAKKTPQKPKSNSKHHNSKKHA